MMKSFVRKLVKRVATKKQNGANASLVKGKAGISVCLGVLLLVSICVQPGKAADQFEMDGKKFELGETLYENPLASKDDIADWVIESSKEGQPVITFPDDRMRLESECHFLLWCPVEFPDNIAVSWDFQPRVHDGLAMFWIAATGENGKDLFDESLDPREGQYHEYRNGDINALHVSYFRRNHSNNEINFHLCGLRKSTVQDRGPSMQKRPDPIPSPRDTLKPFRMQVIKYGPYFRFSIHDRVKGIDMLVIDWKDDGEDAPVLEGGKIGFRQMKKLIADYADLRVRRVLNKSDN